MLRTVSTLLVLTSAMVTGQRPPFAGSRPIGFPELVNRTTTLAPNGLGDRFGEGTTQKIPVEANGDRDLIDRLSKLPIDKQPFWFINWQALEEHRKNPQSYPQRPSVFVDSVPQNNAAGFSNNQGFSNSNPGFPSNTQGFVSDQGFSNSNQGFANNQGFQNNNQGFLNNNQGLSNPNNRFINNDSGFSNTKPVSQSNNNGGFTNSINGFVLTDPALVNTPTQNLNTNFEVPNKVISNSRPPTTSSGFPNRKQTFTVPNQGLSTINQGFSNQNQGVTSSSQGLAAPNKGFTSSSFSSNIALSNANPNINSRFSASSAAQSTSSNNKSGDGNTYNYNWNNSYSNSYNYSYNYTTHSKPQVTYHSSPKPSNPEYVIYN